MDSGQLPPFLTICVCSQAPDKALGVVNSDQNRSEGRSQLPPDLPQNCLFMAFTPPWVLDWESDQLSVFFSGFFVFQGVEIDQNDQK